MNRRSIGVALLAAGLALPALASASTFDNLEQSASGMLNSSDPSQSTAGTGTLLRQLGTGSFNPASMQNVAGVLGYCAKQGYTESATERVKNKLLGKLGGQREAEKSADYQQGLAGVLEGGEGGRFNLANLKDQVGTRVCNAVTDRAVSSFLGK